MTAAPARVAARVRLFQMLDNALTGVEVSYSEPSMIERQSVWLGTVEGQMSPGPLKAGRKRRYDEFSITVHCFAVNPGESDAQAADAAVADLFSAVDDVVANSANLAVDGNGLPGLTGAYLTTVDGPNPGPYMVGEQAAGYGSELIARVFFQTYLS